ncbi:MAG TPA: dienelactone hydrolase family protein [Longimicrobiales bacterium]|nr:dienelactone hydrolase family protein [Longimicrobiales bacterium]
MFSRHPTVAHRAGVIRLVTGGGAALLVAAGLTAGCSTTPEPVDEHAEHATPAPPATGDVAGSTAVGQDPTLPADAAGAPARLAASPRHGEWAMIDANGDSIRAWVVYPERDTPAPVVLVVHEIYGVTHWIRAVADQLAAEGFIAIAPDLMTAANVPTGEDGDPIRDQATAAIRSLDPAVYHPQLRAIAEWGMALPAAAQLYGIVGFCWGGTASFTHAIESPRLGAAVVYYGSSPATERLQHINAPVLGLYGQDDARVNATVPDAEAEMRRLGKPFEAHFYEGAGHGFLRQQDGRDGANLAATREAWPLTVRFFRQYLDAQR